MHSPTHGNVRRPSVQKLWTTLGVEIQSKLVRGSFALHSDRVMMRKCSSISSQSIVANTTSTIYQLFIPANMMFSRYLDSASTIMAAIGGQRNLANHMHNFATSIRAAITTHGIVTDPTYGAVYAYEVDGFGSGKRPLTTPIAQHLRFTANRMDDANIPSLLSAPFFGYLNVTDPVYQNTRKFVLSKDNPYFMRGPVIDAYVKYVFIN